MGESSCLNFGSICRTCMHVLTEEETFAATTAEQPEILCHSIFDTVEECGTMQIVDLLATTAPQLQVIFSDELPQKICRECFRLLLSAYRFQQMCLQSEQQMRGLLAKKYTDVKLIMPTILAESLEEAKQYSMVEEKKGVIHNEVSNNALEVQLANGPLQNNQFLKKEEFIDEYEYNGEDNRHETSIAGTNLADMSVINDERTPTAHESEAASDELSSKEDINSNCTSDVRSSCAEKVSNSKNSDDMRVQNERINEAYIQRHEKAGDGNNLLNKPTYSCNLCKKYFSHRRFLGKHLKRHEKWENRNDFPKKPLNTDQRIQIGCDICGRRFNKPESLYKHKQAHNGQCEGEENKKIYACVLCDNTYSSKSGLGYHKKRKHSDESSNSPPRRHVCEFCPKGFQFRADLVDHLRSHTGEKPFLCSLCGKSYKSSSIMKQHLIRHSGVKELECPHCPKKFACSSDLSKHKVTHRLVKPHNCDTCGAAFAKPYQLKKHKRYHNGDKPFKCEYCEKCFVCMDHQRRHMRTHTGEKPYKCKYCERAFGQSNDLIKHLRSHLGENIYKCELCPSSFRLAAELRSHFASHRNDDEETRARNMLTLKEEDASLRLNLRANGGLNITTA